MLLLLNEVSRNPPCGLSWPPAKSPITSPVITSWCNNAKSKKCLFQTRYKISAGEVITDTIFVRIRMVDFQKYAIRPGEFIWNEDTPLLCYSLLLLGGVMVELRCAGLLKDFKLSNLVMKYYHYFRVSVWKVQLLFILFLTSPSVPIRPACNQPTFRSPRKFWVFRLGEEAHRYLCVFKTPSLPFYTTDWGNVTVWICWRSEDSTLSSARGCRNCERHGELTQNDLSL